MILNSVCLVVFSEVGIGFLVGFIRLVIEVSNFLRFIVCLGLILCSLLKWLVELEFSVWNIFCGLVEVVL